MGRLHPRTLEVQRAEAKMGLALIKIAVKFELTFAETVGVLSRLIETQVRYMIREERHGDQKTPGDLQKTPGEIECGSLGPAPERLNVAHSTHDFILQLFHGKEVWDCQGCNIGLEDPDAENPCPN